MERILLTEDVLLKTNFNLDPNKLFYIDIEENKVILYWSHKEGVQMSINHCLFKLPHIKYLHQLQNLYFALTNTKLQYNYGGVNV